MKQSCLFPRPSHVTNNIYGAIYIKNKQTKHSFYIHRVTKELGMLQCQPSGEKLLCKTENQELSVLLIGFQLFILASKSFFFKLVLGLPKQSAGLALSSEKATPISPGLLAIHGASQH